MVNNKRKTSKREKISKFLDLTFFLKYTGLLISVFVLNVIIIKFMVNFLINYNTAPKMFYPYFCAGIVLVPVSTFYFLLDWAFGDNKKKEPIKVKGGLKNDYST